MKKGTTSITLGLAVIASAAALAVAQEPTAPPAAPPASPSAPAPSAPAPAAESPAAPAGAEIPLNKLFKDLADRNHYPVAEGLMSAHADVTCNIMPQLVAAFPDAAGQPIAVKFLWNRPAPDAAPTQKFAVTGVPAALTDLSNRLNQAFGLATDFVVTQPIYWTIAQVNAKAVKTDGKIVVSGDAKAPGDPIRKLTVDIDGTTLQVGKVQMDLGQAQVTLELTNVDQGGKWGVASTTVTNPQYRQVVKVESTQIESFWMPSKITVELLGPDGKELQPMFVYEFTNWQVNKGMPAGIS